MIAKATIWDVEVCRRAGMDGRLGKLVAPASLHAAAIRTSFAFRS